LTEGLGQSPNTKHFGAFSAENHAFGDTKSTINHLFVSQLELNSELTVYTN